MRLNALAKAIANQTAEQTGHSVLIYGGPKMGKTTLAATSAECEDIDTVYWFDNENGFDTLMHMVNSGKLSEEAASKIIVIPIKDTRAEPYAIETMLKALNSIKTPVYINLHDGRVLPKKPMEVGEEHGVLEFQISKLTTRDIIVTDSLSQLGDSALNGTCVGQDYTYKPLLDNYGLMGKWLGDCMTIMQQAAYCHFIACTHEVMLDGEDEKKRIYPLCGTSSFSPKLGKYFGTVIYMEKKGIKHAAGSSSVYSPNKITGSRRGIAIEKMAEPSLVPLFSTKPAEPEPPKGGLGKATNRLLRK